MKTYLKYGISISLMLFIGLMACMHTDTESSSHQGLTKKDLPNRIDFNLHIKPILSDRCFKCHGPDESKVEAGLAFHTKEAAFVALGENADRFAIVPGDAQASHLLQRIYSDDSDQMMPPPESNLSLTEYEKELLKQWIVQGAEWKEHWAFLVPVQPEIPKVEASFNANNEIDHFIFSKLSEQNLNPSEPASPEKLIRRLSFDLRGLPPELEDIQSFQENPSEDNYQRIVEKYLDSWAHAERMCNEWLDLARYADTHGYQDDLERIMWPWRDWVLHAFKKNMPYDQFVTWQLAGDLLPDATKEQIIATAFNRNHKITQEGGVISEEYRLEYVTDRTNTFGAAFLGLTFECAKCHDHKYDPISQREYFQVFGYFNNVDEVGLIEPYGAIPEPYITLSDKEMEETLHFINNLDSLKEIPLMVMKDLEKPRKTHILNRGLYDQPQEEVEPQTPTFGILETTNYDKTRKGLAQWLFNEKNPLTARVVVNRLWQQIFGRGIVSTVNDFGNQGALPTHPELLDFLAIKLMEEGWDVRKMIKYMVSSSTYRQSSKASPQLLEKDPENKWLARISSTRLSAEMIRDHALSISGLMVSEIGGPSVKPYQPEGLWNEVTGGGGGTTAKYVQDEGSKNYRRSMYTFWKRTVPPPNMITFDAPSRDLCTVKRETTSTPLQALVLMNDPQFLETSRALAIRALEEKEGKPSEAIQFMFKLATSRSADKEELTVLVGLFEEERNNFEAHPEELDDFLGTQSIAKANAKEQSTLAAMIYLANTIFNLDETIRKG